MKIRLVEVKAVARAAGVMFVTGAVLSLAACDGKQENLGKEVDEAAGEVQDAREEISEGETELVEAQSELERAKEEAAAALAASSPVPDSVDEGVGVTPDVSPTPTPMATPVDAVGGATPMADFPPTPEASPAGGVVAP
jgi:hypothetical protein